MKIQLNLKPTKYRVIYELDNSVNFYDMFNCTPLFTPGNWIIVKNLEMSENSKRGYTDPLFQYAQSQFHFDNNLTYFDTPEAALEFLNNYLKEVMSKKLKEFLDTIGQLEYVLKRLDAIVKDKKRR